MASKESSPPPAEAQVKKEPEVKDGPAEATATTETPAAPKPADDQVDGASAPGNGNPLADSELKVEVKLADLQADPDNPLYSAKTFEELQLYVFLRQSAVALRCHAPVNIFVGARSCSKASIR